MFEELNLLVGQKVAIICGRYQYAGVLARVTGDVGGNVVVLTSASAIEQSGRSNDPTGPKNSDRIPNDLIININGIEICYQPAWLKNV